MTTLQTPPPTDTATQPPPAISAAGAAATWTRRKYRTTESIDRRQKIIAYTILVLGSLAFLVPFYFVINGSLKTEAEVAAGDFVKPAWTAPADPGKEISFDAMSDAARAALLKLVASTSAVVKVFDKSPEGAEPIYIARFMKDGATRQVEIAFDGKASSDTPFNLPPLWSNYPRALSPGKMNFFPALANTVVITTLCVFGQVLSCSLVGFGFARFSFRGRGILFMVMLSTMMLPAQVTMIPVFILFRYLGMIDSFWPLIIPAWLASPFFVFMFRQFFAQIPEELIEAARIDGASNWRVYWQLMLPLSGPVIAIVCIYTFLGTWNDFLAPLIYLNSPENRTLTLALNAFKSQYGTTDVQLLMAASVVCMIPCVVLFFAAQKYFVESVAMTGLKS